MKAPGTPDDEIVDLRKSLAGALKSFERIQKLSEVPAAEYVPALVDIWEECRKAMYRL